MAAESMGSMANRWATLADEKARLEAELKRVEAAMRPLGEQLMESMATDGLRSLVVEIDGTRYTLYRFPQFFCRLKDSVDRSEAMNALRDSGYADLVSVQATKIRSLVKECKDRGSPIPEVILQIVDFGDFEQLRVSRS